MTDVKGGKKGTEPDSTKSGNTSSHEGSSGKSAAGFDLESLKLPQNFSSLVASQKNILDIAVRKPKRHEFIRVRSDPGWEIDIYVLEVRDEMDSIQYVVGPALWNPLMQELRPMRVFTAINTQGTVFLLPAPLPGSDGKMNSWHESRLAAVEDAKLHWVRFVSNKDAGAYETQVALGKLPEPQWPNLTFQQIFDIAFKDRYIDSFEHPVLQRIRGEIL
jgi:hypothetical protein